MKYLKPHYFLIDGQLCTAQQQTNFIYIVAVVSHKKKTKKKEKTFIIIGKDKT